MWYFRLHGSHGVFIEAPADPKRWSFNMRVNVEGRVVDPTRDPAYDTLLMTYADSFFPKDRADVRIVQVDVRPGYGRGAYLGAIGFIAAMVLLNLFMVFRLWKLQQQRPRLRKS